MEFELNELQIAYLEKIKKQRTSFFLKALGGLFLIPLATILLGSLVGLLIYGSIAFVLGGIQMIILYIKRIIPLRKDLKHQTGIKIKLQVIRKQFFPLTNEYYLFFNDTNIPNIKVDSVSYNHYKDGDYYTIGQSKHSKIIFEDYERFDLV